MRTLVHTGLHHTQGPAAHPPPTIAGNGLSSLSSELVCQLPCGETPVSCLLDIWCLVIAGMHSPGAGCELLNTEVFIGSLETPAESPLEPCWRALPSVPLNVWAYPCCRSKGGIPPHSLARHPDVQTYTLLWEPLSTRWPGYHTLQFCTTEASIMITYPAYPYEKLFSLGELIESPVVCQQQRIRLDHELDVVKSIHLYRIVFLEVWANIISYGYHISFEPRQTFDVPPSVVLLCRRNVKGKGPRKSLGALGTVTYLRFLLQTLLSPLRELIFAPNVSNNMENLTMGELILWARNYSDFKVSGI